ncbi:protein At-4/1 [Cajanus cajan]|uniref:protein At-4/1 n=1 Tax=Cajanus cajan TaxID=3821 RepID=UPI00098DA83E|nr:protein At-4/1 [Cajanus cajan]
MAATSDEEMESLLSALDEIYEDAKSGISEMQLLQSNYNAEFKMRESLQLACNALKRENDRLAKLYAASSKNLADQLDYRTKCLNLREDLERANSEVFLKEHGHRKDMELLKRECEQKIACLEAQVKESLHEKATYEATISQLHGDLAAHKSHMQVLAMRLDQIHVEVESKYNSEVQDLRECLAVEQEEKNELNRKIQNLEKELLICKAKLVDQQQEMTANWHVETLKQKIMKLRRENEVLKRKFSHSEEKK